MKTKILVLMCSFLLISSSLFAADGDLIVNGNVGIGTTSPAAKLDVNGGLKVSANGGIQLSLNSISSVSQRVQIAFTRAGTQKWIMGLAEDSNSLSIYDVVSGNYSLWMGSNSTTIYQNGTGNVAIGSFGSGDYRLYINGSIYASSGWYSSDMKFKENISSIESPLNKILNIQGVSFNWKTKEYKEKEFPEGKHYGVIAQDIEKVLPEVVKTVKVKLNDKELEEEEKSVAYFELIPILIEAIKEQAQKIERLKEAIAALTQKK